jgi:sigma-B regulation protein RsbU (phosphoserine phosphatase)
MLDRKPRQPRRPPFWVALVGLVVVLTAVTGLVLGGLGWRENRGTSRALVETAMAQTARLTAAHAARFLTNAEAAARLGPQLVTGGQLDPSDPAALERFTVAVLRSHPDLTWVSYGDREDRFVGAHRDSAGRVLINRSFPRGGLIRLEEDELLPGGGRRPERRSDDHGYRPTRRPYFRLAEAQRDVAWTEPYEFYAGGGLGVTCAAPLLDSEGQVRGVFTVDFSLDKLGQFLATLGPSPRGRVFIATKEGGLLVGQRTRPELASSLDADLLRGIAASIETTRETAFELDHRAQHYLGRAVPLGIGNLRWLVHVIVPERDYTDRVDAQARRTLLYATLALVLAAASGIVFARWIARPLRELAGQALRIRRGDLDLNIVPRSRDEIGVLTRAMGDMVRALRDRDFIRETLGRYVSPELAEQVLRNRDTLRLGGELRDVTILMSDLRGFSELSEQLGPEVIIGVVNRYLARMTPVILRHGGAINDFIGDGVLVVFGAPFERPDDPERALRCAWSMQKAMAGLNDEQGALGLPPLAMGIALHAGPVVAGNVGSPDRLKYAVIGPAVNAAARLQSLAAGGDVLVSEAVLSRLDRRPCVGPPETVTVKGVTAPITVHRLLGLTPEPAPGTDPEPVTSPLPR